MRFAIAVAVLAVAAATVWLLSRASSDEVAPRVSNEFVSSDPRAPAAVPDAHAPGGNAEDARDYPACYASMKDALIDEHGSLFNHLLDRAAARFVDPEAADAEFSAHLEEAQARHAAVKETVREHLAHSPDPRHQLVLARLQGDRRYELLDAALRQTPNDAVLLYTAVVECTIRSRRDPECPEDEWRMRLLEQDHDNGAAWIYAATQHFLAGRRDDAVSALQRAAASDRFDTYSAQLQISAEQAAYDAGIKSFADRRRFAAMTASRLRINLGEVRHRCETEGGRDGILAQACVDLAQRLVGTDVSWHARNRVLRAGLEGLGRADEYERLLKADRTRRDLADLSLIEVVTMLADPVHRRVTELMRNDREVWAAVTRRRAEGGQQAASALMHEIIVNSVRNRLSIACQRTLLRGPPAGFIPG